MSGGDLAKLRTNGASEEARTVASPEPLVVLTMIRGSRATRQAGARHVDAVTGFTCFVVALLSIPPIYFIGAEDGFASPPRWSSRSLRSSGGSLPNSLRQRHRSRVSNRCASPCWCSSASCCSSRTCCSTGDDQPVRIESTRRIAACCSSSHCSASSCSTSRRDRTASIGFGCCCAESRSVSPSWPSWGSPVHLQARTSCRRCSSSSPVSRRTSVVAFAGTVGVHRRFGACRGPPIHPIEFGVVLAMAYPAGRALRPDRSGAQGLAQMVEGRGDLDCASRWRSRGPGCWRLPWRRWCFSRHGRPRYSARWRHGHPRRWSCCVSRSRPARHDHRPLRRLPERPSYQTRADDYGNVGTTSPSIPSSAAVSGPSCRKDFFFLDNQYLMSLIDSASSVWSRSDRAPVTGIVLAFRAPRWALTDEERLLAALGARCDRRRRLDAGDLRLLQLPDGDGSALPAPRLRGRSLALAASPGEGGG